jgi:AraC-like DNA-binding protein
MEKIPMKFQKKNPTTISSWVLAIAKTLDKQGYDSKAVLTEAGIQEKTLLDPDKRIKLKKMSSLWELAVKKTGDSSFGLSVAENVGPESLQALGYALMASENMDSAFKRVQRFYRMISNAVEITLEDENDKVALSFGRHDVGPELSEYAIDAFFSVFVLFTRHMMESIEIDFKIEMIREKPENIARYYEMFGHDILFSSARDRILIKKIDLKKPLHLADSKTTSHNDLIITKYLEQFDKDNIVGKVHGKLIDLLPIGEPSLEILGKELGMSKRSLNRYLKEEHVTYRDMLSEIREHLATRYLSEKKYSIIEIAFKLGYTDSSNFARAFKKWVGKTPGEYRNKK